MFEHILFIATAAAFSLLGIGSAGHALLNKRDPRAQLSWALTCLLLPLLGSLVYWLLGVNRVQTRARKWQAIGLFARGRSLRAHQSCAAELRDTHPEMAESMLVLLQLSRRVTGKPLLTDNCVRSLCNGDDAYPAMIEAIDQAQKYVYLMSYLFVGDAAGKRIAAALTAAGRRGVDVRVLVDAIGSRVGGSPIGKHLDGKPGVRLEYFLPPSIGKRLFLLNLRNHRKILIVDGLVGFTGGMNISSDNVLEEHPADPIEDLHFVVRGPIVHTLEEVFSEDWCFRVGADTWPESPAVRGAGSTLCRGIKDGPNEDFEALQWVFIGALGCARQSVRILTPYFIPSRELISAMRAAVLRGVSVQVVLPARSNLRVVDWACNAMLPEIIDYGIEVFHKPAPFAHSKLVVVDDFYVNVGSANWDPRSLRLNFEFNLEVFDPSLARLLSEHHQRLVSQSAQVSALTLRSRPLAERLRDACAKILSPYL